MTTLALDTATPGPGLAIVRGTTVLAARTAEPEPGAGRRVAEEIHRLLGEAGVDVTELTRIVVGIGPGGFTGLRIGMATALALGQATGAEVVGVCSLETLARGMAGTAPAGALLVPVIDAKRREVFTGAWRADGGALVEVESPRAVDAAGFGAMLDAHPDERPVVAGDGVHRIAEVVGGKGEILPPGPAHTIRAEESVRLADAGRGRPVVPMYLRLPDAEVNRRARGGTAP